MSCSELVDNKKKSILVLGKTPTQELDDTKIKGEAKYPVNFTRSRRKFKQQFLICECSKNASILSKRFRKTISILFR